MESAGFLTPATWSVQGRAPSGYLEEVDDGQG